MSGNQLDPAEKRRLEARLRKQRQRDRDRRNGFRTLTTRRLPEDQVELVNNLVDILVHTPEKGADISEVLLATCKIDNPDYSQLVRKARMINSYKEPSEGLSTAEMKVFIQESGASQ